MRKNNYISFNRHLARIVRNLGSKSLARDIYKRPTSIYEEWRGSKDKDLFIRRLSNQTMEWRKRKFLTDMLYKGPSMIRKISELKKYELGQIVEKHFNTNSWDTISIRELMNLSDYLCWQLLAER
ncbi:MAG: hypothetical protein QXD13_00785 [Candidatus Pacearchaeota archaeon]